MPAWCTGISWTAITSAYDQRCQPDRQSGLAAVGPQLLRTRKCLAGLDHAAAALEALVKLNGCFRSARAKSEDYLAPY